MTATLALPGSMLIGATDVRGSAGETHGVNPATGETLEPSYGLGDESDVDRAVALAWEAFPVYRATTLEARAAYLALASSSRSGLRTNLKASIRATQ